MSAPFIYTTGIPATGVSPSSNYLQMQQNTDSIEGILDVDMIGFNNANGGFHSKVTLVDQVSNPGSSASQYVTFSKLTNGSSETYAQKDAVSAPIQLTRGVPLDASSGYTYLPGGLYLLWANISLNPSGVFNFPGGITLTNIRSVNATSDQPVALYNPSRSSTSVTIARVSGSGAVGCYVTVIGS